MSDASSVLADIDKLVTALMSEAIDEAMAALDKEQKQRERFCGLSDGAAVVTADNECRRIRSGRLLTEHARKEELQRLLSLAHRRCVKPLSPLMPDVLELLAAVEKLAKDWLQYRPSTDPDRAMLDELLARHQSVINKLVAARDLCEGAGSGTNGTEAEQPERAGSGSDPAEGGQAEGINEKLVERRLRHSP